MNDLLWRGNNPELPSGGWKNIDEFINSIKEEIPVEDLKSFSEATSAFNKGIKRNGIIKKEIKACVEVLSNLGRKEVYLCNKVLKHNIDLCNELISNG